MVSDVVNWDEDKIREQLNEEKAEILLNVRGESGLPLHMNPDRDDLAQDFSHARKGWRH